MTFAEKASLLVLGWSIAFAISSLWAIAAHGGTALSPYGSSPSVSPTPPLQSTIAGEQP